MLFRLPEGATVGKFRLDLAHQYPMLEGLLARCAIAVNGDFVGDQTVLLDDCEAAVLPPVSGGSHSNSS